jgi:hypothetical protein
VATAARPASEKSMSQNQGDSVTEGSFGLGSDMKSHRRDAEEAFFNRKPGIQETKTNLFYHLVFLTFLNSWLPY